MSRIIAGRARGLRLATPAGDRTRPTTDRVREAFFSALATWNDSGDRAAEDHLEGLSVVDLFAGSGAVGLEAASRGAGPVVLVEKDAPTARIITENARKAALDVQVVVSSAESWLRASGASVDVVWMDPPYPVTTESIEEMLVAALGRIVQDGVVVVERSVRDRAPEAPEGAETWSRAYGETVLHWCRWAREDD